MHAIAMTDLRLDADTTDDEAALSPTPTSEGGGRLARLPGWLVVGALLAVLVGPLLVALGVLHDPRWYPLSDLAMTELRVRDVFSAHPPLIGLPGRIEGYGVAGSHLGPLSFYAMAPVYWLTGSSAWGLKVAVVVLDAVALGLCLSMVRRRGGTVAALGLAAVLVVLLRAYGPHQLTEPWNPFLPPLWWVVFLLAVWCVLCADLALLPVAVFAGSFCAQTHVPYAGLVGVLAGLAFGWVAVDGYRRRSEPGVLRRNLLWGTSSLALGLALWAPVLIQQFTNDPGNLSVVVENFRHPTRVQISLGTAVDLWLARVDPWGLVTGDPRVGSWTAALGAAVLLAAWVGTVALAWKRRQALAHGLDLLRLHVVVATALVAGFISLSRIIDVPWFYLHLWGMGTTALLVLATGWTAVELLADRFPTAGASSADPRGRALAGGLVAALLVVTGMFAFDAAYTEVPAARLTRTLRGVAPDAVAALTADDAPGGGPDGRYLVRWVDPIAIGEHGWGLFDELERVGLDVYVDPASATGAGDHRVLDEADATAVVSVVGGPYIDEFRARPGVTEIAYFEPRTPAEVDEFDELRADVQADIDAAGLTDRVDLDGSLFAAAQNLGLPGETREELGEMIALGLPLAAFVEPLA
jgi:hypothetical protein